MNEAKQVFLDSLKSKSAKNMWNRGLILFCEFTGKDVNTILQERQNDLTPKKNENIIERKQRASNYEKILEQFHAWLTKDKGYKLNTARTYCMSILQLCARACRYV